MKILILTGPTASGKTSLSLLLAEKLNGEIINADMGQFYSAFSIGTAKPDWKASLVPHHLFDCVITPRDTSVVAYRTMVLSAINDCLKRGRQPILVGGSLFYIKSLFFPPTDGIQIKKKSAHDYSWDLLHSVDPKRALAIDKNDAYRINRALDLFYSTGIKPSEQQPQFVPLFDALVVFLNPSREVLYKNINDRCDEMFDSLKWVEEVESCIGTDWEAFIDYKGLIGYREILAWIRNGKKQNEYAALKETIKQKTRQYAKRQEVFWKKFSSELSESSEKSVKKVLPFSVLPDSACELAQKVIKAF